LLGRLGLRREDLRLLRVGDIDLTRDEIHLRHSKGGEDHVLPLGFPDLRQTLYLELIDREPFEHLLYPKTSARSPLSTSSIDEWFKRCCERAGVPGYTMHQLRHAAADDLMRATGSTAAAQALLRHKSVATTEAYLHAGVDDLRRAIEKLSGSASQGERD
jgi:integrase/recombinase XerD